MWRNEDDSRHGVLVFYLFILHCIASIFPFFNTFIFSIFIKWNIFSSLECDLIDLLNEEIKHKKNDNFFNWIKRIFSFFLQNWSYFYSVFWRRRYMIFDTCDDSSSVRMASSKQKINHSFSFQLCVIQFWWDRRYRLRANC